MMKNQFLSSLKRLGSYISPYKWTFFLAIFLTLVAIVLSAMLPFLSGLPTTEIAKNIAEGTGVNFPYVFRLVVIILIVGLVYSASQYLASFFITNVVQHAMRDLRQDISQKINRLPVSYFDTHQYGDVLSRVTNDVDAISNAMQQSFISIINAFLGIAMAIIAMLTINATMTLIVLVIVPLSLVISRTIVSISQKYFREQQKSLGDLNGFVQENLTGFSILKLFGREQETLKEFTAINHRLGNNGFKAAAISGLMMPLVNLVAYSVYIVIAIVGAFNIIAGVLTVGNLQAFIQYIWQVSQPVGQITQLSAVLQSASAATKRVFEILDEPEEVRNTENIPLPETIAGDVSFKNVSFSYTPDKPLIKDLNIEVKSGQTVAIVGPTGAGKTTLINLLMRFYDVDRGSIQIDGIDTKAMDRSDVRSVFGMVLQDAWLYNASILENIRFGKLDATNYEVVDAAKTANVDHFIRTMPDGYDMQINEEGSNISLGQKQLITIARAIISDPKILILDEATSSVDTRLESLIQKAMDKVMEGRTSFVIAHRLSTIRNADLILVMNQGQIIEQGTHDSLLERKGFYEQLYNSQFSEEAE